MNIKVDVPKRGCCSQWVSWHHNASEAACRTLWGGAVPGIKGHCSTFFWRTQALEAADFADVRPLFAPLMHAVGKEIFVTAWPCFFADVLGLQQLRVLQHNRQDHRSDAGFFHLFSFFLWAVDIIGDVQPPDRHGSKVPRPKLNFPNWGESVMWTQIPNTCQFRLKRGLRKWKCQFATWRSSKPVSWWEKSLESKFSSTNTSSFRSTRWLCRRTSPTRASRPDPGSSRSRLSSSVSIPSSTDSTPCLSSSPLQSRWGFLCFNQNYLPFIPKVHEAWESGNWRDPWEGLDK